MLDVRKGKRGEQAGRFRLGKALNGIPLPWVLRQDSEGHFTVFWSRYLWANKWEST